MAKRKTVTKRDLPDAYAALSPKHRRFVDEYVIDFNGAGAAERAGFSKRRAKQTAHELLERPDIKNAVALKQAQQRKNHELAANRVVDELARIGLANMLDYITIGDDGRPFLDFTRLTRDQAAAIQELVVDTMPGVVNDDGEEVRPEVTRVRFKLYDKRAPLVDLGKHLGLFEQFVKEKDGTGGEGQNAGASARELVERRVLGIAKRLRNKEGA